MLATISVGSAHAASQTLMLHKTAQDYNIQWWLADITIQPHCAPQLLPGTCTQKLQLTSSERSNIWLTAG